MNYTAHLINKDIKVPGLFFQEPPGLLCNILNTEVYIVMYSGLNNILYTVFVILMYTVLYTVLYIKLYTDIKVAGGTIFCSKK